MLHQHLVFCVKRASLQCRAVDMRMGLLLLGLLAQNAAGGTETPPLLTDSWTVRFHEESPFGVVEVIDYASGQSNTDATDVDANAIRFLRCGNSIIGAEWLDPEFDGCVTSPGHSLETCQLLCANPPKPSHTAAVDAAKAPF